MSGDQPTPDVETLAELIWGCDISDLIAGHDEARAACERILASDWLATDRARQRAEGGREALLRFADTRGVNVGDGDSEWWDGYRQAQRECLHDAVAAVAQLGAPDA